MKVRCIVIENNSDVQTVQLPTGSVVVNLIKKEESGDTVELVAICICNEKQVNKNYYLQLVNNCNNIPESSSYAGSIFLDDNVKHLIYWN